MEQLWKKQENETVQERYPASVRAIRKGMTENSMAEPWNDYFRKTGEFLLLLEQVRQRIRYSGGRACGGKSPSL